MKISRGTDAEALTRIPPPSSSSSLLCTHTDTHTHTRMLISSYTAPIHSSCAQFRRDYKLKLHAEIFFPCRITGLQLQICL